MTFLFKVDGWGYVLFSFSEPNLDEFSKPMTSSILYLSLDQPSVSLCTHPRFGHS